MDDTQSEVSIQEVIESLSPQEQTGDADAPQAAGGEPGAGDGGQEDTPQDEQHEQQEAAQDDAGKQEQTSGVSDEQVEAVRTLLADGWTREELLAFADDQTTQKELREGRSLRQAALSYLRRQSAAERGGAGARKRGAPIARNTSSGGSPEMDPIKSMSDAQYDKFMADLRRRAMRGDKIRI